MPNNIKLSEKIHITVRWLSYLSKNKTAQPQSLGEFTIQENISFYFLQKTCRLLKKQGLIKSKLGNWGGYLLAKPANKITLKEIIEAVEGPISLINCANYKCSNAQCGQKNIWDKINKEIEKIFSRTKLSDLI
jgi:Rrf2 family cysteine metabolism transcriptional repressor